MTWQAHWKIACFFLLVSNQLCVSIWSVYNMSWSWCDHAINKYSIPLINILWILWRFTCISCRWDESFSQQYNTWDINGCTVHKTIVSGIMRSSMQFFYNAILHASHQTFSMRGLLDFRSYALQIAIGAKSDVFPTSYAQQYQLHISIHHTNESYGRNENISPESICLQNVSDWMSVIHFHGNRSDYLVILEDTHVFACLLLCDWNVCIQIRCPKDRGPRRISALQRLIQKKNRLILQIHQW